MKLQYSLFVGVLLCCLTASGVLSQESPLCFCAVRGGNLTSGSNVLPFTTVPLNDGGAFDSLANTLILPPNSTGGYFWLTWSIGIPQSSRADVRLLGGKRSPDIIRKHLSYTSGVDTTSRTELISLAALYDTITLSTDFPLFSDAGWQTSFCGFSLFSTMSDVVAFNVGKSTSTSSTGTIIYDIVNVDTVAGYSTTSGQYAVKQAGVYVVSFALASPAGSVLTEYSRMRLCLSGSCFASIYMLRAGEDMATQTVLVDTQIGQTFYTTLDIGPIYSDIRYQTSMMGFQYTPYRSLPYAWSVADEGSYSGPINPLPFEVVLVNRGSGWSVVTNTYTAQEEGVYYIHMTAGMYTGYPTKMELMVNGISSVNVYRQSAQHADYDTRGRAFILRLAAGDTLRVQVPSGFRIYSTGDRLTTFSGFRLYQF